MFHIALFLLGLLLCIAILGVGVLFVTWMYKVIMALVNTHYKDV